MQLRLEWWNLKYIVQKFLQVRNGWHVEHLHWWASQTAQGGQAEEADTCQSWLVTREVDSSHWSSWAGRRGKVRGISLDGTVGIEMVLHWRIYILCNRPRSRRHEAAATSHIAPSRSQSYLCDWVAAVSHISIWLSHIFNDWRRLSLYYLNVY